jgi:hypothetical protein
MKFAVLVMATNVEIPLLVFSSLEAGLKKCKEIFDFSLDAILEGENDDLTAYRWAIESDAEFIGHDYQYVHPKLMSKLDQLIIEYDDESIDFQNLVKNTFAFE